MNSSTSSTDTADGRFVRIGAADARTVTRLREEFAEWLRTELELDPVRFSDVVLTVYEALSNAAEFAYDGADGEATVTLQAHQHAAAGLLDVTVTDRGRWRPNDPALRKTSRGRGIPLMRALADGVDIEPSPQGTRVHLQFSDCHSRVADPRGSLAQA
jgi:serine/threonine-protein kinase RsbW